MNDNPNKITEMPYAKWLEETLRQLTMQSVRSICIAALTEDDEICTSYYNASMADLFVISGFINKDAVLNEEDCNEQEEE